MELEKERVLIENEINALNLENISCFGLSGICWFGGLEKEEMKFNRDSEKTKSISSK